MPDKVNVALAGLHFGRAWARRQLLVGGGKYFRLVKVCDLDIGLARECAAELYCTAAASLDEVLNDPQVEAVVLMTPPAGRAKLVEQCVRAGKPVLTTKPFETDSRTALAVLELARERRVPVHCNSPAPVLTDDYAQLQKWRQEFDLGRPVAAYWETYASYHERPDGSWYDDPELCPFAPVVRIGIYGVNDLVRIFGPVESVAGVQSRIFTGRPTADNAAVTIKFTNGGVGTVFASFCIGEGVSYPARLILHCERGTLYRSFCSFDQKVELQAEFVREGGFRRERLTLPPERRSGAYLWREFYNAVRRGGPLPDEVAPEVVAEGVRVVELLREQARSR